MNTYIITKLYIKSPYQLYSSVYTQRITTPPGAPGDPIIIESIPITDPNTILIIEAGINDWVHIQTTDSFEILAKSYEYIV
jgi:hypothetical protein